MVFTMKDEDIKKSEFEDIAKGLSHSGKVRSAVFLGNKNGNLEGKISDLCNRILQGDPNSFWVAIDSTKIETPYDWCSQFARNLRTTSGVKLADLAKFALNAGKIPSLLSNHPKIVITHLNLVIIK